MEPCISYVLPISDSWKEIVGHVQSGLHWPGQAQSFGGSHCSGKFITPLGQRTGGSTQVRQLDEHVPPVPQEELGGSQTSGEFMLPSPQMIVGGGSTQVRQLNEHVPAVPHEEPGGSQASEPNVLPSPQYGETQPGALE